MHPSDLEKFTVSENGSVLGDAHNTRVLRELYADMRARALQQEGNRVFECTRSRAAHHEAGHAVMFAHLGARVRRIKVWPVSGRAWSGECWGPDLGRSDDSSSVDLDRAAACLKIAGWRSEILFDPANSHSGSSIDERLLAMTMAHNVSLKTGAPKSDIFNDIIFQTDEVLLDNEPAVHRIAGLLMRNKVLRGDRLGPILSSVTRHPRVNLGSAR